MDGDAVEPGEGSVVFAARVLTYIPVGSLVIRLLATLISFTTSVLANPGVKLTIPMDLRSSVVVGLLSVHLVMVRSTPAVPVLSHSAGTGTNAHMHPVMPSAISNTSICRRAMEA